jgi:hypothetical protein
MSDETEKKEPLSRRDFLRRAGKEAVDTGTKIVPGGNLARQALGLEAERSVPWWQRALHWRAKKREQETSSEQEISPKEQDTGTND